MQVARDELTEKSSLLPSAVKTQMRLVDDFISKSHLVTMTIMASLSNALHADSSDRFEQHHRDEAESNTTLVLLRYPKDVSASNVGHNAHTDIGSLTLLFSKQPGLQILSPETHEWEWVAPREGHAIINIGDSLRFLSGKRLASCMHRVIPTTDHPTENRYSIAYFLRPVRRCWCEWWIETDANCTFTLQESDVKYEDPDGKPVSAAQWHDNKYLTFADTHEKQATNSILLGGMDVAVRQGITA